MEKPRTKRLKVVSACGECRRKKTKCNAQLPCQGCIKANVECEYTRPRQPLTTWHQDSSLRASVSSSAFHSSDAQTTNSIRAIEQRLLVIEDILRAVLSSDTFADPSHYYSDLVGRTKRRREADEPAEELDATGYPVGLSLSHTMEADSRAGSPVQLPPLDYHSPAIHNLICREPLPSLSPSPPAPSSIGPSAFHRVTTSSFS